MLSLRKLVPTKLIFVGVLLISFSMWQNAYPDTIRYQLPDGSVHTLYDRSEALLIGAAQYNDPSWPELKSVPNEISNLENALHSLGFDEVDTLLNPDSATLSNRLKSFLTKPRSARVRLLVYYAGHGSTDNQSTGYLVPVDAPSPDNAEFRAKAVGMDDIVNWTRKSDAKHIITFFDSCFSGAVFLTRSNLKPSELYINDADRKVRQFITSGSENETVPAKSDFLPALITGLQGAADTTGDGIITGNELGYWLKVNIAAKGKQTPQYGSSPQQNQRLGDVVFLPSIANRTIQVSELAPVAGDDTRKYGIPNDLRGSKFTGIEVYYYRKPQDGRIVLAALDNGGIPYVVSRAVLNFQDNSMIATDPERFMVNAIACGNNTPIGVLKQLAQSLIAGGVQLRAIVNVTPPRKNPNSVWIYTQTEGAQGKLPINTPTLTKEQIDSLRACPSYLHN
jgi:Caspase domain